MRCYLFMEEKIFDISKLADSTYFADNRLPAHSDHHYYANEEEMLNEEMWDACDAWENKLGYKVPRSMAKFSISY